MSVFHLIPSMNPSGDFSVSAWVKLSNKNAYRSAVTSRSEILSMETKLVVICFTFQTK